ncbi:MAG: hypothetical protein JXB04_03590, partial [Kiritimatiellae bacterium]|nr:hypothetical protein [Kiritimatiellia bacterium]
MRWSVRVVTVGSLALFLLSHQPGHAADVEIAGRQITVNGSPFQVRGVGYSPVPICADPQNLPPFGDYYTAEYGGIHERDLPLIREMGANTIRLWRWDNEADH